MRHLALAVTALLALGTLSPGRAAADPVAPATDPARTDLLPPATAPVAQDGAQRRWYGWQLLGVDLAAATVVGLGLALENTPANDPMEKTLIAAGTGMYLVGGPLVHLANGHARQGGVSLAMRVGLPLVGAAAGFVLGSPARGDDGAPIRFALSLIGAATGGVTALVVDDLALGWEERPATPTWTPTVAPTSSGGMLLGLAGSW